MKYNIVPTADSTNAVVYEQILAVFVKDNLARYKDILSLYLSILLVV